MDSNSLFRFGAFSGINNVDRTFRMPVKESSDLRCTLRDVENIENMDIDNVYVLSTRPGSDLKIAGTDIHSLWSDGETCLFVDGTKFYRLNEDYSITELLAGLINARMSYDKFNDRIYLTNGSYVGYYHDLSVSALTEPTMTYKKSLPAGQRIAYYRGQLFVASRNVLYVSDALCDHYDVRTGYRVFENDITMLRAVDRGIYVADGRTWFISGDNEFQKKLVSASDAVPFTDALVAGQLVKEGVEGSCAAWVSSSGICIGDSEGNVKNVTHDKYVMEDHGIGGAAVRTKNGVSHYLTTLE
jgi:hypothetical protein